MRNLCNSVASQNVSRNSTRRKHTVKTRDLIFRVCLRSPWWILQDCHEIGNQENVRKIENENEANKRKIREFCKIFWKIKILDFIEV